MLDFGFSEILLTSAIALVVLGPERLPKVARQVGNWMGRARAMARQLSEQLEREVSADELLKSQTRKLEAASNRIAPTQNLQSPSAQAHAGLEQIPLHTGHAEYNPPVAATDTHVPVADTPPVSRADLYAFSSASDSGAIDSHVTPAAASSAFQADSHLSPGAIESHAPPAAAAQLPPLQVPAPLPGHAEHTPTVEADKVAGHEPRGSFLQASLTPQAERRNASNE